MKITREEAYGILELPADSDDAEVKKSFKRLALKLHPDKNSGCEESAEKFKMVSAAYARLTSDQGDDELDDEDFEGAFTEQLFEQLFGDSGFPNFAFMMQEMLGGLRGGMHSRMRKGPRVRLHRPGMPAKTRGVPARAPAPFGCRAGVPPPFMRAMFQTDFHDGHGDSSSEWETDDEAGGSQAGEPGAGPSDNHRTKTWSSADSSSEWETDNGSQSGESEDGHDEHASGAEQGQQQQQHEPPVPASTSGHESAGGKASSTKRQAAAATNPSPTVQASQPAADKPS